MEEMVPWVWWAPILTLSYSLLMATGEAMCAHRSENKTEKTSLNPPESQPFLRGGKQVSSGWD